MTPLKEMFNAAWIGQLADSLQKHHRTFNRAGFMRDCMAPLETLELNQRMRHISITMHNYLPEDLEKSIAILKKAVRDLPRGYTNLVFPDYISQFGTGHFEHAMDALAYFTGFGSSEFAIREFLKRDLHRTLKVMYTWTKSSDHHVRRLASEGSRPSLPWSFRLPGIIAEPALTRPVLDTLCADPEMYVRKSVANHLNDISKFAPDYMLEIVSKWDSSDARTAWIIRHGNRTLIKKGHAGSLRALKFEKDPAVSIGSLKLSHSSIKIGDHLEFTFKLASGKKRSQRLAVDYRIHYVKKNGTSVKTFKLKEFELGGRETLSIRKKQAFTDFSTRKHQPGMHKLEIQVNGKIMAAKSFRVIEVRG